VRRACEQGADRPHLSRPAPPAGAPVRAVPWSPLQPRVVDSVLPAVTPAVGCTEAPCRARHARSALSGGDLDQAAAWCAGLPSRQQEECWFRAAEGVAAEADPALVRLSVVGCAAAGTFVHECLSHAIEGWTAHPPDPTDPVGMAAWSERLDAAHDELAVRLPVPELPTIQRAVAACATERLVGAAPVGTQVAWSGEPADVRSSVAARLVATAPPSSTLDELADAVVATSEGRAALPATVPSQPLREVPVLWEELTPLQRAWLAEHPDVRVVPYRGYNNAVRIGVSDARQDAAISVLEAAARTMPRRRGLLEEGRDSAADAVAWTAVRLLADVDRLAAHGPPRGAP